MEQFPPLGRALESILPKGTNDFEDPHRFLESPFPKNHPCPMDWRVPPIFPPDMFAAAGHLCRQGGVVAYFEPSLYDVSKGDCHFGLTRLERNAIDDAARTWQAKMIPPDMVWDLWRMLVDCWDQPLTPQPENHAKGEPLPWWKPALMLVMISDLACVRVLKGKIERLVEDENGVPVAVADDPSPFEGWLETSYLIAEQKSREAGTEFRPPATLALMADTAVACVLPKMRVAPVGATLRNVSRNLSLLPGRGEVRCFWYGLGKDAVPSEDLETLDILLIPEPRKLAAVDFVPHDNGEAPAAELRHNKWDYFHLNQSWIDGDKKRRQFVEDCVGLVNRAKDQSRSVNAVILPEYAVDYDLFQDLCTALKMAEPKLEFVISGSSTNCDHASGAPRGNYLLTHLWDTPDDPRLYATQSRRKHHRWRMDRTQIDTYGLSSVLNPKVPNWWEATGLGRRELQFHRFRRQSAFSVLICEELARSDPCHEILRAVAPNLIFALLMDGPQIKQRWPGQYAANLADDPGSSVLSFTSYGLIDRSNTRGKYTANHSVAMWKDDSGTFVEIAMPSGDGPRGVLLSLWAEHVKDATITGKRSIERAWRYSGHYPVTL